jgi:hypothetical protein
VASGVKTVYAEGKIAIALELRRGALCFQLCTHLGWIDLYPINPHSLASFPKNFAFQVTLVSAHLFSLRARSSA